MSNTSRKGLALSASRDFIFSVLALVIYNGVLQLVIYPGLETRVGAEAFGTVLYLISFVSIMGAGFGTAASYSSGDTFPTTIPLDGIDYFAPYIPDKGLRDLYLVKGIHTSTKVKGAEDDKLRITFDLKFSRQLFADYKIVPLPIQHTFSDTSLERLQS